MVSNKVIRGSTVLLLLLTLVFSCSSENDNCELWITGFKEGTTTVRKLGICRENTFFLEKIDFFDKEVINGIWEQNDDSEILLKVDSTSEILAKVLLTASLELIIQDTQGVFTDKLVEEMELKYLN